MGPWSAQVHPESIQMYQWSAFEYNVRLLQNHEFARRTLFIKSVSLKKRLFPSALSKSSMNVGSTIQISLSEVRTSLYSSGILVRRPALCVGRSEEIGICSLDFVKTILHYC